MGTLKENFKIFRPFLKPDCLRKQNKRDAKILASFGAQYTIHNTQ